MIEDVIHQPGARGQRTKFRLKSYQPACRNDVIQPHAAAAVGLHILQGAPPLTQALHDRALVFGFEVHDQDFVGLLTLAILFDDDDFGA